MKKILGLFLFVFATWTVIRVFTQLSDGLEEIFFKPVLFIISAYSISNSKKIGDFLTEVGFSKEKLLNSILWGLGAVIILIIYEEFISHFLAGHDLRLSRLNLQSSAFYYSILVSFFTAVSEEIVFRGFIFKKLLELKKGFVFSAVLSIVAFVLLHIPRTIFILHYSPADLFNYILILIFLGTINTLLFWKTRNLASSITAHTIWNIFTSL